MAPPHRYGMQFRSPLRLLLCLLLSLSSKTSASHTHLPSKPLTDPPNTRALLPTTQDNTIEAFIIPHSHCDAGWLTTFDSYYRLNTSHTLTNLVKSMTQPGKENRRFSWAEISFFERWYKEQNEETREKVKMLVKEKRLEFVDGGWVQPDQACLDVKSLIDQSNEGHRFLSNHFGVHPRIGWAMDPFGASAVVSTLWARIGMDAMVLTRLPYKDVDKFKETKSLEFVWRGSDSLQSDSSELLTHVFESYFCYPGPYDFEAPGAIMVGPDNVARLSSQLVSKLKKRAAWYRTPKLLIPWGCDFAYQKAETQFKNTELLLDYINNGTGDHGVKIRIATPSEYFDSVKEYMDNNRNISFPVIKNRDFFPYTTPHSAKEFTGEELHQTWAGFYSSRPNLKIRHSEAQAGIHSADILLSAAFGRGVLPEKLIGKLRRNMEEARRNVANVAHHDAITGTMCEASEGCLKDDPRPGDSSVLSDYLRLLRLAKNHVSTVTAQSIHSLIDQNRAGGDSATPELKCRSEEMVSHMISRLEEGKSVVLTLFNPLPWARKEVVSMQVPLGGVKVMSQCGNMTVAATTRILPLRLEYPYLSYELSFEASLPPLGFGSYVLSPPPFGVDSSLDTNNVSYSAKENPDTPQALENDVIKVTVVPATGRWVVENKRQSTIVTFTQSFLFYRSYHDDAYTFRPISEQAEHVIPLELPLEVVVNRDASSHTLTIQHTHTVSQIIRVHKSGDHQQKSRIEYDFIIGPPEQNTEIIVRFDTDIDSRGEFLTDSNGYQLMRRVYLTPNISTDTFFTDNFYPSVSAASIRDSDETPESDDEGGERQFALLSRRSHAVTSVQSGSLEIMLHRRTNNIDVSRAVRLDDTDTIIDSIWLVIDKVPSQKGKNGDFDQSWQRQSRLLRNPLVVCGSDYENGVKLLDEPKPLKGAKPIGQCKGLLEKEFPPAIELQSLQVLSAEKKTLQLRLHNLYDPMDHDSQPTPPNILVNDSEFSISASHIMGIFGITQPHDINWEETTLTGYSMIGMKRIRWPTEGASRETEPALPDNLNFCKEKHGPLLETLPRGRNSNPVHLENRKKISLWRLGDDDLKAREEDEIGVAPLEFRTFDLHL